MSIHAVALARWLWSIRKYMAQMRIAIGAADFRACHEERTVTVRTHRFRGDGLEEGRPTSAGFELGAGCKQRIPAAHTLKGAGAFFMLMGS